MKIAKFSIDAFTRNLSGAMWIFARLPDDGTTAALIHRSIQRDVWSELKLGDRMLMCLALPFIPLVLALLIIFFTGANGLAIKKRTGKGIIRQVREQIECAAHFAILPPWYYMFELHDDDKRLRGSEYLNRFETKAGLYLFLRDSNGGLPVPKERSTACIKDKALFMDRCRAFGVATAPVLLNISNEQVVTVDSAFPQLPECDVFVKPLHGNGGSKATRWHYLGSGRFKRNNGDILSGEELLDHLRQASRHRAFLVQPLLVNHKDIADLANGVLATVRVMTCRNEQGEIEVTNAAFRMARTRSSEVDNFHAGGIATNVDMQTGELGRGTRGAWGVTADGWYERHSETGIQITHRKLPCWPELIALVRHAHSSAFSDQVVIGWDVALLDSGPCIMEANKAPDLDILQRVGGAPIGNQRLGKLLAFNLRRAVEAKRSLPGAHSKAQNAESGSAL